MNSEYYKKNRKETGNLATIRGLNRNAVLNNIRSSGGASRINLIKSLKLAPATITAVVNSLINDGLIIEEAVTSPNVNKRSRGRPSKVLQLNSNAAFSLGLYLRVEHNVLLIDTSINDYSNNIRFGPTVPCTDLSDINNVFTAVLDALDKLQTLLPQHANIIGLGVGIPGVVALEKIQFAPNIPCIEGKQLYQKIKEAVSFPIFFENDVNLLVVRELEERPHLRSTNFCYLFISQGVGAGTALHGELWRSSGWSGEIGQLQVPFADGKLHSLESLIGIDGYYADKIAQQEIETNKKNTLSLKFLNSHGVKPLIDSYTSYLSLAIQVLNASFDLDVVIINASNNLILDHCMPKITEILTNSPLKVDVMYTPKSQNAVVEGAALLALKHAVGTLHNGQKIN